MICLGEAITECPVYNIGNDLKEKLKFYTLAKSGLIASPNTAKWIEEISFFIEMTSEITKKKMEFKA